MLSVRQTTYLATQKKMLPMKIAILLFAPLLLVRLRRVLKTFGKLIGEAAIYSLQRFRLRHSPCL
jgi:hypothetical protein